MLICWTAEGISIVYIDTEYTNNDEKMRGGLYDGKLLASPPATLSTFQDIDPGPIDGELTGTVPYTLRHDSCTATCSRHGKKYACKDVVLCVAALSSLTPEA